jgi:pimeloyl-ACP methyl ester carboxylesterase
VTASPAPRDGQVPGRGVRLHVRDWVVPAAPDATADATAGAAPRAPLLLLHGLASAARIWDLAAPILARDRRVVALDQRGHGLSEKPDAGYDFATVIADDLAAADALGLGRRLAVAGHSWGGNVALELAAAHPDRVAALALVDGGFGMLRQRPGATWERISRDLAPPDFAGTPRETYLGWIHEGVPGSAARPAVDEIALEIVALRPDGTVGPRLARAHHMAILRAMWDEDAEALYGAVRCPVLLLLAEPPAGRDAEFLAVKRRGVEAARRLLAGAPRADVEWMAETVHDIPLQRPEELAARIARFLDEAGV